MPARPTWKGYLKISLVNIPIKVFPATDAGATLSFNQLHAECQTRIQQKRWCPNCQREVPNSDIVKGYEFEKGRYVLVNDEDIETFEGDVDFQSYRDEYQIGLREIIDAKIEGREVVSQEVEAPPKVVNLMDALRKSLDSISSSKKKVPTPMVPARAEKK